jgi:DNA polymerase-3 subunit epsilon
LEDVTGAIVLEMASSNPSEIVTQLTAAESKTRIWPLALLTSTVAVAITLSSQPLPGILLAVVSLIGVWWLHQWDTARRAVVVYYDVNDEYSQRYQSLVDGFAGIESSPRKSQITAEGGTNAYQWKVNAGASKIVRTVPARTSMRGPQILATNINVPTIQAARRSLYFMPDRVLLQEGSAYTDIPYESLTFDVRQTRWIESSSVPGDAPIIDHTWAYVNKGGGPDRRFRNNRQIPIIRVGELHLSNANGFKATYQLSNPEAAPAFGRALEEMRNDSAAPARSEGHATASRTADTAHAPPNNVPDDERRILTDRPVGWEYLLYAAALANGKRRLEVKWRRHQARKASTSQPRVLDDRQAIAETQIALNEVTACMTTIGKGFDAESQTNSFGPPGSPGDPERIRRLAANLIDGYDGLLDWAARVRGLTSSGQCATLLTILPTVADKPVLQIREFIDRAVSTFNEPPTRIQESSGKPTTIELELAVGPDKVVMDRFNQELQCLSAKIRR